MKLRSTITAAAAATLVIGLSACSSGEPTTSPTGEGSDDVSLAYVYGNEVDPFWPSIACGAQAKADELGVDLEVYALPDQDSAKYQQALNSALLENPTGLIATPLNPNQFVAQFQEQMAKGVPVVSGQATDPVSTLATVWSNGDTEGYLDQTMELLPEEGGKVAVLGGVEGLVPVESRYLPLVDAIKEERPDLEFLETQYSGFDPQKAQSAISSLIIANPDLRLVIAATGPDGQGAVAAVKAAGAGDQVTVLSFDATPSNVEALEAGDLAGIISQNPYEIGATQVSTLVDYLESRDETGAIEPAEEFIGIPQALITTENVDAPESRPYIYSATCE